MKFAAIAGLAFGIITIATLSSVAQAPTPIPSIWLQASAPGTLQTGNLHISGTAQMGNVIGGVNTSTGTGVYGRGSVGIWGETSLTNGVAVYGNSMSATGANTGVSGSTNSPTGTGVSGISYATAGAAIGVYGSTTSPVGYGVFGSGGVGVQGEGSVFGGFFEGNLRGLQGTGPTGVRGYAYLQNGTGVEGFADNINGSGVGGWCRSTAQSGQGLHGIATHSNGTTYGVVGEVVSPNGYALFFLGPLAGFGTKSFRIDHPLDPLHKYLQHYCTEGAEPLNVYSGNVVTDASGYSDVSLPSYFSSINKDFRYQLTVVDDGEHSDFVLVKVVKEIASNTFRIRTSAPNVKVSWRVEATRNDRWVQKNGAPVEFEKPSSEYGKYQAPELYGEPRESGAFYRPMSAARK